jgi:hypothetical protein
MMQILFGILRLSIEGWQYDEISVDDAAVFERTVPFDSQVGWV